MANFSEQVNDLTGFASTDDTALADWLNSGAKELINIFTPELLMECSTLTNLYIGNTDTTMDLDASGKILHVTRENADSGYYTPCREIPAAFAGRATDSNDMMYYATVLDPVYWRGSDSGGDPKLFVLPTPTANQPAKIYHVKFPTIAITDSAIINFPDEADYLVILYASCKALQRLMNNMHASIPTNVEYSTVTGGDTDKTDKGWEKIRFWIEEEEDSELAGVHAQALGAEMQQFIAEYQWYQSQQTMLKQEYNQGVQMLIGGGTPKPPQEEEQQRAR